MKSRSAGSSASSVSNPASTGGTGTSTPIPTPNLGLCDPSTPGDGTSGAPFQLFSTSDFFNLLGAAAAGDEYLLCADLDFGGSTRNSINNFSGTLRGNGHTLSNLTLTGHGIFKTLIDATIDGVSISGFSISPDSAYPAGILAGLGTNVEISRVSISNSRISSGYDGAIGGLIGQISSSTRPVNLVRNLIQGVTLNTSKPGNPVAGFVGVFYQEYYDHVLSNNLVEVTLDMNQSIYCSGGFVGYTSQGILRENSVRVRFTHRGNYERAGGFLGCTEFGQASSVLQIASNRIEFDTLFGNSFGRVGGIVGALEGTGSVDLISNWVDGRVDATHPETKGMLIGHYHSGNLRVEDNHWNSDTGSLPAIQSPNGYIVSASNTGVDTSTAQLGTPFSGGEWGNASVWNFAAGSFPDLVNLPR